MLLLGRTTSRICACKSLTVHEAHVLSHCLIPFWLGSQVTWGIWKAKQEHPFISVLTKIGFV